MEEHTRPRMAHHLLDFLSSFNTVAVHSAPGTGGFLRAKGTALNALGGIIQKRLAIVAKLSPFRVVMLAAIQRDHLGYSVTFSDKVLIHRDRLLKVWAFVTE